MAIRRKSREFAIRIVKLYKILKTERKEYDLSKQLLRSGTSIGANIAESECAMSDRDFVSKLYISYKECNETMFWLEILYETDYLTKKEFDSIYKDCTELKKMLSSITKSMDEKIRKKEEDSKRKPRNPNP